MIWNFTIGPRVLEMAYTQQRGFHTSCQVPTALKVCQESRATVEKSYGPHFKSLWYPQGVLFNFSLDTLYLSGGFFYNVVMFMSSFGEKEISGIRYIAIDEDDFNAPCNCEACGSALTGPNNSKMFCSALTKLTSLKEVTVVYDFESSFYAEIHAAGYEMQVDPAIKSNTMRFLNHTLLEFRRLGIFRDDKGYCKWFHFLENCKHHSVFGWRQNRILALRELSDEDE